MPLVEIELVEVRRTVDAAVVGEESPARRIGVTAVLDLDDLGAEERQQHRGVRAGRRPREIDDAHPRERQLGHGPMSARRFARPGAEPSRGSEPWRRPEPGRSGREPIRSSRHRHHPRVGLIDPLEEFRGVPIAPTPARRPRRRTRRWRTRRRQGCGPPPPSGARCTSPRAGRATRRCCRRVLRESRGAAVRTPLPPRSPPSVANVRHADPRVVRSRRHSGACRPRDTEKACGASRRRRCCND